jgi:hypothetical protein
VHGCSGIGKITCKLLHNVHVDKLHLVTFIKEQVSNLVSKLWTHQVEKQLHKYHFLHRGQKIEANEKKFKQKLILDVVLLCFAILFVQTKCIKVSHLSAW